MSQPTRRHTKALTGDCNGGPGQKTPGSPDSNGRCPGPHPARHTAAILVPNTSPIITGVPGADLQMDQPRRAMRDSKWIRINRHEQKPTGVGKVATVTATPSKHHLPHLPTHSG